MRQASVIRNRTSIWATFLAVALLASLNSASGQESSSMRLIGDINIALKTKHGLYVTAPPVDQKDKGHVRQAPDCQAMETFVLVESPHRKGCFGLRTTHGRYVTAVPPNDSANPGRIRQARDLGEMETFEFIPRGGNKFALRTIHGRFVTATPPDDPYKGNLRQARGIGAMETFRILSVSGPR